jgi:poly-gamma-glutamate synthesis protein (capsule biosynthesis protein)
MHQDVKTSAAQAPAGLRALWADVEPLFQGADLAFANLETPIAPATGRPGRPFQFNAPAELPAALRESGIRILATANNHAFDQGRRGLQETLDRLDGEGLLAVGSGRDRAQAEETRMVEVRGLRVAFLAFTDIFNVDLDRQATQPWVRGLDPARAAEAVRAARAQADLVVVSVHWGIEYFREPSRRQRTLAAQLAQAGADLILGHHPHVLQPVEVIENGGHRTVVAYSLGNFVSNQDRMYRADLFPVAGGDSRDGAAFTCRMVKRRLADGSLACGVEEAACEPLWTENNWREHQAGKASLREIRVVRVNAAIRRTLDALEAPAPLSPDARLAGQEYLRTLLLRRRRASRILGQAFVEGGTP